MGYLCLLLVIFIDVSSARVTFPCVENFPDVNTYLDVSEWNTLVALEGNISFITIPPLPQHLATDMFWQNLNSAIGRIPMLLANSIDAGRSYYLTSMRWLTTANNAFVSVNGTMWPAWKENSTLSQNQTITLINQYVPGLLGQLNGTFPNYTTLPTLYTWNAVAEGKETLQDADSALQQGLVSGLKTLAQEIQQVTAELKQARKHKPQNVTLIKQLETTLQWCNSTFQLAVGAGWDKVYNSFMTYQWNFASKWTSGVYQSMYEFSTVTSSLVTALTDPTPFIRKIELGLAYTFENKAVKYGDFRWQLCHMNNMFE